MLNQSWFWRHETWSSMGPRLKRVQHSGRSPKICVAGIGNVREHPLCWTLFWSNCMWVLAKITYTCNTNLASALKNSLCWPLYFNQVVMAAIWYQWGISPCTHYDTRSPVGIWWCWVGSIPEFLQGIQIYNAQIKILYSLLCLLRKKCFNNI